MKKGTIFSFVLIFTFIFSLCFNNATPANHVYASENATRIYGSSRFQTSYAIADEIKAELKSDNFSAVIIADGMNCPDALAGSYLAASLNAPILMVNSDNQNSLDSLSAYIRNNLTTDGTIYILGGTAAVSEDIELLFNNFTVKRLSGNNRYNTNLKILNEIPIENEPILVCTGTGFADSLSASATGFPILLVGDTLSEDQLLFLEEIETRHFYIIGGTAAVNDEIEATLKTYGSVERISGKNRYVTSVEIAKKFFPDSETAIVAYAWNFPDGLCGGPLANIYNCPLILTGADMSKEPDNETERSAATVAMEYTSNYNINSGTVLGGEGVLSDYTVNLIFHNSTEEQPVVEDKIVVLDPGHGGAGTGAFKDWSTFIVDEAVINYKLSQYTKAYLEETYANVQVYVTKANINENPGLSARVKYGVDKGADVFVSQHVNSTGQPLTTASGVYALVPTVDENHSFNSETALEAQALGRSILDQLESIGWKNNGYLFRLSSDNSRYQDGSLADYYSIVKKCREAQIPGLIMEHGFCNNLNDAHMLTNEEILEKTAVADAIGIANYLGLSKKHTHEGVYTIVQKAGIFTDGLKSFTCTVCNEVQEEIVIPGILNIYLDETYFYYDGCEKHPMVIVTDTEGSELILSEDYTVTYEEECIEVGSYDVTIDFIGAYEGQETLTFYIEGTEQEETKEESL